MPVILQLRLVSPECKPEVMSRLRRYQYAMSRLRRYQYKVCGDRGDDIILVEAPFEEEDAALRHSLSVEGVIGVGIADNQRSTAYKWQAAQPSRDSFLAAVQRSLDAKIAAGWHEDDSRGFTEIDILDIKEFDEDETFKVVFTWSDAVNPWQQLDLSMDTSSAGCLDVACTRELLKWAQSRPAHPYFAKIVTKLEV